MGDKLVPYASSHYISQAVLKFLREKGITDEDLIKVGYYEDSEHIEKFATNNELNDKSRPSLSSEKSDNEDKILEELFSKGDTQEVPNLISHSMFCQAVLLLKGVVSLLSQETNIGEKHLVLDVDVLKTDNENDNIVYLILSYVNNCLFDSEIPSMNDGHLKWIHEGVTAVVEIVNESLAHPFIVDALEISRNFVRNLLENLCSTNQEAQLNTSKIIKMFGTHNTFGKFMITFLLEKFLETGDLLRESEQFKFDDDSILVNFHVYRQILLEMWPGYAETICDGGGVGVATSSRKRKEKVTKPRLSLSETVSLVNELERWTEMLSESTRGLSILQPDFYLSVQTVIKFLTGTLCRLNRQKL